MRWMIGITAVAMALAASHAVAQPAPHPPLVLAAASLQESINAEADAWAAHHHRRPVLSLAASSALARQIEAGAPADLFISADEDWMDDVAAKHLLQPGSRADLVGNALVLIAPAAAALHLRIAPHFPLAQALAGGRLALADPAAVPAGRYAKAALTALSVWPDVADHIASADSVRSALALVARGEAPLGIVYATDAKAEPRVRVVGVFPAITHPPILYPIGQLAASTSADAPGFRAFLMSAEGRAIFRRYGFTILAP